MVDTGCLPLLNVITYHPSIHHTPNHLMRQKSKCLVPSFTTLRLKENIPLCQIWSGSHWQMYMVIWMTHCFAQVIQTSQECLKNVLPGLTTVVVCCRRPTLYKWWLFWSIHWCAKSQTHSNLPISDLNSWATVSIKMPKNTRDVDGPSYFSIARGTP